MRFLVAANVLSAAYTIAERRTVTEATHALRLLSRISLDPIRVRARGEFVKLSLENHSRVSAGLAGGWPAFAYLHSRSSDRQRPPRRIPSPTTPRWCISLSRRNYVF